MWSTFKMLKLDLWLGMSIYYSAVSNQPLLRLEVKSRSYGQRCKLHYDQYYKLIRCFIEATCYLIYVHCFSMHMGKIERLNKDLKDQLVLARVFLYSNLLHSFLCEGSYLSAQEQGKIS